MDIDTVSIIITFLGIGFTIIGIIVGIGLTIIGAFGNYKFNKLSAQIESIEIKLRAELSRIDSEINLLRKGHTIEINGLNNTVNYRIKALEDVIRSNNALPTRKEPNQGEDAFTRGDPKSDIEQRVKRLENMMKSNEGDFSYDKYHRSIRSQSPR